MEHGPGASVENVDANTRRGALRMALDPHEAVRRHDARGREAALHDLVEACLHALGKRVTGSRPHDASRRATQVFACAHDNVATLSFMGHSLSTVTLPFPQTSVDNWSRSRFTGPSHVYAGQQILQLPCRFDPLSVFCRPAPQRLF